MNHGSRHSLFVFPLAALLNSFSMTALLLILGVAGRAELAADIGLVQGATLAMFYAFSANARGLILAEDGDNSAIKLLKARFVLVLPLSAAAYFLSVGIGTATASLALVLICRRIFEWMAEIALARHECLNQPTYVMQTLLVESVSLLLCLLLVLRFDFDLATSAVPWALSPLLAVRRAQLSLRPVEGWLSFAFLLPHLGSTAIIGMSVYVFRISIALLTGKAVAGELFTAFAIGGVIPTIFGYAVAPTLAHRFGSVSWPKWLWLFPFAMVLMASGLTAIAIFEPFWLKKLGRSTDFWLAVGFSVAGGAIMCVSAGLRARLIHRDSVRGVFGADVLANVLIAICVPFVNYLFGSGALTGLYALSACLSLVFFWRVGNEKSLACHHRPPVLFVIGFLLVLPLFFQFNGGLFRDAGFAFEAGGMISKLPLPVSVLVLFAGVALLGNYSEANRALTVLFFSALLFLITALSVAQGNATFESAKLVLLAQYLLPIFGLVFGQMYGAMERRAIFERAALAVLLFVIPIQIVATWMQGYILMHPQVVGFTIYQHLQYFPMVVVALSMMIMPTIGAVGGWLRWVWYALIPLLAVQVVASLSITAIAGFVVALVALVYFVTRKGRACARETIGIVMIALVAGAVCWATIHSNNLRVSAADADLLTTNEVEKSLLVMVRPKTTLWQYYAKGILESPGKFLFGHATPPDRIKYRSAHNYWLDAVYNFGALAVLPLLFLLFWSGRVLWQRRVEVMQTPSLFGAAISTIYLVLIENMFNVGMRQPYPGIVTFFIWGLLIARLCKIPSPRDVSNLKL